jgi:CRP-like cAMP-binding protein
MGLRSPAVRRVTLSKGGIYLETPAGPMQFGAPSETLKDSLSLASGVPETIVLGQELFSSRRGVALADVEFPVYYQLFAKRRPLKVVGTEEQLTRVSAALQEAMLGPESSKLLLEHDFAPGVRVPDLEREWAYFRRGNYATGELSLADALEPIALHQGRAALGGGVTLELAADGYVLSWGGSEQVRLPSSVPLPPPREVSHAFSPPDFGVTPLGRSHGFDPDPKETTSGFVLWVGGRGVMVDPPVHSTDRLREAEIDPRFIEAVLLTHCHADHDAGTLQKALEGGTVTLYTLPTIFASYRRKWSALSGIPDDDFAELFDFRPVKVGAPVDILGAQVIFRYTLHSIPTLAFEVHFGGRSFNYSSDTLNDPEQVQAIYAHGGLEIERRDELMHFDWDHDLVLHEAGVPPLHTPLSIIFGRPEGDRRRTRVVHTTPSRFPDDAPVPLAEAGRGGTLALDVALKGEQRAIRNLSLLGATRLFRDLPLSKAADLLGAAKRVSYAAGERLIAKGDHGDALFVITAGKASVNINGQELKVYGLGDYIGESAVFLQDPRRADVVAKTALEVLRIPADRCRAICEGTDIEAQVRRHSQVRELDAWSLFDETDLFSDLSATQREELEALLHPVAFDPGTSITHAGGKARRLVLILEGVVTEQADEPRTFGRGGMVGDAAAVLAGGEHEATSSSVTAVRGLSLGAEDLASFVDHNPGMRVRIEPWRAKAHLTSDAATRLLEEYL